MRPGDVAYDIMPSRFLLDTNIVRAGFVGATGASRLLLQAVLTGKATAVASTALMLEYEDVLLRPECPFENGHG